MASIDTSRRTRGHLGGAGMTAPRRAKCELCGRTVWWRKVGHMVTGPGAGHPWFAWCTRRDILPTMLCEGTRHRNGYHRADGHVATWEEQA